MKEKKDIFNMHTVGFVRRTGKGNRLKIEEKYRSVLKQLDIFGHVMVLWWADRRDNEEKGVAGIRGSMLWMVHTFSTSRHIFPSVTG